MNKQNALPLYGDVDRLTSRRDRSNGFSFFCSLVLL
jgi:hypothetical protein